MGVAGGAMGLQGGAVVGGDTVDGSVAVTAPVGAVSIPIKDILVERSL